MPTAPSENHEVFTEIEPKVLEASKADAAQSKAALSELLSAKMKRIDTMKTAAEDERGHEQYAVARNSVNQRQRLLETITA